MTILATGAQAFAQSAAQLQQNQPIRQNAQFQAQQRAKAAGRTINEVTRQDFTRENCASRLISALDRECHDPNYAPREGVYARCKNWTISQLYSAMDKQLRASMSSQEALSTIQVCSPYRSFALSRWLEMRTEVEESATRNSAECLLATDKLNAAKACYTMASAFNGNELELRDMIRHTCGYFPDVAYRYTRAANIGFNTSIQVGQGSFNLTLSSGNGGNWRGMIEAVLVTYIYQAQAACGNQVDIIPLSAPAPGNKDNLLNSMQSGFAVQMSGVWGKRAEDIITKSAVTGQELKAPEKMGNVFPIRVSSLSLGRARLASIIIDSIIGTEETRDDLDIAIITSLGGRRNETNAGIYGIISSLDDGDLFVLKDNSGKCMTLQLKALKLVEVDGTALCSASL